MADYYTSQQLAQTVGIAESTIIELQQKGLLQPTVKDGRSFFSSRQAHCLRAAIRWARKDKIDLQAAFTCVEERWLAHTTAPKD
jgi:DNA-binding transcriptional MerR regulator